ncbi:MAG TPA: NAD(P)-dependent oxidoreductase, partial [Thermoanaerobaculia bacterium]|nr:NAD(P)-dependent oxidoreductase [Thermoanaerobaculia bacterium]
MALAGRSWLRGLGRWRPWGGNLRGSKRRARRAYARARPTKKILVTGSSGTIGRIVCGRLEDFEVTRFDLPEHDARDYEDLAGLSRGHDVLVHLAWDTATESWRSGDISLDNQLMTVNAYEAALRTGVPRVIMASSVHADDYSGWTGAELMKATAVPAPDSPYGASKVFMEALGRYYAKQGLEVVCVRFMGVTPDGRPSPQDPAGK